MEAYILYISDFVTPICDLMTEVLEISWPPYYNSMGKNSNRSYLMIMSQKHLFLIIMSSWVSFNDSYAKCYLGHHGHWSPWPHIGTPLGQILELT